MRAYASISMLLLLLFPAGANGVETRHASDINEGEILWLMVAGQLCPEVADPEAVEAALQTADDATPFDVRSFLLNQKRLLVEQAAIEGKESADRMCWAASHIAREHGFSR